MDDFPFRERFVSDVFQLAGGRNSNSLFVGVEHVHETFDVVAVADAGLFLAHLKPGDGGGVVGERAAEDIVPMRGFFGGGAFHILANPVADLAVGEGIFYDFDELFVRDAGGLEPEAVEGFAEIFLIVAVEFAGEV